MTDQRYEHLLAPGRIGRMAVRNRIIVTAMGVSLAEADGHVGERLIAFHEKQAEGGAGLIVSGVLGVAWPVGAAQPNQTAISDDRFVPGLTALTERVRRHGAKIAAQLHHGGLAAKYSGDAFDVPLWAPCYPQPFSGDFVDYFLPEELTAFGGEMPQLKVMDAADIDTVVAQFTSAAVRAECAGFDGVELHAGHGYLLSSFLSPKTNARTDDYGGPLENRARLLLRIIASIREATEPDFPVWVKLDAVEYGKDGGITLVDSVATARLVEAAGVDAITVTSYHDVGNARLHSGSNIPHDPDTNVPAAIALKASVSLPVIASGRIDLQTADKHIGDGRYDFLALGRKLLADPMLPAKLLRGEGARARPCIYCYTCVSTAYLRESVRCAVNPEIGFEFVQAPRPMQGRRFVVIGGGPGGMEAACRLAEAGNAVSLLEQGKRLGGTLRFAALAYDPNEDLLNWLVARVRRAKVDVRLNVEATVEMLRALDPDAIVVATGGRRDMPVLPGSTLAHVYSGDDMRKLMLGETSAELKRKTGLATRMLTQAGAATGVTANLPFVRRASKAWMPLAKHVVIIGGELVGVELAEFLHDRGRTVTVLESAPRLGRGLLLVRRMRLLAELKAHGVALHGGVRDVAIERNVVSFTDANGTVHCVEAGNVVVATGATGDTALADRLTASGFVVEAIGDCTGISYIEGAIRGAAEATGRLLAGKGFRSPGLIAA